MVNESAVVVFDDERAVANAGVMLPALLAGRLGIERLVDARLDLGDRGGAANPGRKVMTMLSAMALGADCIEDCDVLRSGQTAAVLGHRVSAPSTLGTFLRAFTFGHVRQLDRVLAESRARAWAAGAGPGAESLTVDVDSFVGEVHGYDKQGASFGYTRKRGYHPILATRAETGEVHMRARKGAANTARGARGSSRSSSPASRVPAPPARSCCAPTRASGTRRSWPAFRPRAGTTRSVCASRSTSRRRSRRSPRTIGSRWRTTPRRAKRRSRRRCWAPSG